MLDPAGLEELRAFRARIYGWFGPRRDALFEVLDAAITSGLVLSLVHLSLEGLYRRRWGSLYAALAEGEVNAHELRRLVAEHPLADGEPIYAVDTSAWPRNDAETSPERGYYHHPSRHSAGKPIVAGWCYSWLAQIGLRRTSWSAPLDVRRVHPRENMHGIATEQVKMLVQLLPAVGPIPTFVFDAGYDPVQLVSALDQIRAALLVRLRRDRCCYPDPKAMSPNPKGGRPRRHGPKFACNDPSTWPEPTWEHSEDDPLYGQVHVRAWAGLHAKTQMHPGHGSRAPRPILNGVLILVEVSRVPREVRPPQALWLWWHGCHDQVPDLRILWRAYLRRFDLEHAFRFLNQVLNWTTPRVRFPEQADRWTWLVLLAYTQLRLARRIVEDLRLPWQAPQPPGCLTPGRVRRAFPLLLVTLDTPAIGPKPCGPLTRSTQRCEIGPRAAVPGHQARCLNRSTVYAIAKPATFLSVGGSVAVKSRAKHW